jgi:hypothetical protein
MPSLQPHKIHFLIEIKRWGGCKDGSVFKNTWVFLQKTQIQLPAHPLSDGSQESPVTLPQCPLLASFGTAQNTHTHILHIKIKDFFKPQMQNLMPSSGVSEISNSVFI